MCGKATLAMEVSRTSMNVASVTVMAIPPGLIEPSGIRSLEMNLSIIAFASKPVLLRDHRGIHIHAGPQDCFVGRNGIENNLHGNALHDLDEISGGIFGRQQADDGSCSTGERIH